MPGPTTLVPCERITIWLSTSASSRLDGPWVMITPRSLTEMRRTSRAVSSSAPLPMRLMWRIRASPVAGTAIRARSRAVVTRIGRMRSEPQHADVAHAVRRALVARAHPPQQSGARGGREPQRHLDPGHRQQRDQSPAERREPRPHRGHEPQPLARLSTVNESVFSVKISDETSRRDSSAEMVSSIARAGGIRGPQCEAGEEGGERGAVAEAEHRDEAAPADPATAGRGRAPARSAPPAATRGRCGRALRTHGDSATARRCSARSPRRGHRISRRRGSESSSSR